MGASHWLDLLTLWVPAYGVQTAVKVMLGTVSLLAAVALWRRLPHILRLPSPAQMHAANEELAHLVEDRDRTVEALHARKRRYRALVETGSNVVWQADTAGRIQEVHGWKALTGRDPVIGGSPEAWLAAVHPADRPSVRAAWRTARADLCPADEEFRLRTATGEGWR